jgi:polysaccharide pyruvyl transferase WcaK-like protein
MLDLKVPKKIVIVNPCGTLNLGDEATVAVLIRDLKRRYPNAEILGLTTNPTDTRTRHGIPVYPARNPRRNSFRAAPASNETAVPRRTQAPATTQRIKQVLRNLGPLYAILKLAPKTWNAIVQFVEEIGFVRRSRQRLTGTDLLIFAGSGQLCDDFGGTWGFPYTILKWAIIARTLGAKIVFLSVGVGPIGTNLSRLFIKWSLRLGDYRSFRDNESKALAEAIGVSGSNRVCPDLVFNLDVRGAAQTIKRRKRVVAINPFPHYDYRYWPVSMPASYASYVDRLASFASWLIKNGYTVLFFPTQLRADPLVIEDVRRVLMTDKSLDLERHFLVKTTVGVGDLIDQLSMADLVVASRFHAVLISFLLNKPVLALSHHSKVDNLMRDMGQSDYLLNIDEFDVKTLSSLLLSLEARQKDVKEQIRSNVDAYQDKVELQYTEIFGVASAPKKFRDYTPSDVLVRPR